MLSSLPHEISLNILLRIPVKSTFACKCVCKSWLHLISDPDFAKMHLKLSVQRNEPNLMLTGNDYQIQSENDIVFRSVSNSSLKSLLSTSDFYSSVKLDYPFNSIKCYLWVELLASCDGLLCLWFKLGHDGVRNFLCLWNPATKEYKQIPKSPYDDDNDKSVNKIRMVALGYDVKSDDYKLLTIYHKIVQVYSLRLNLWRRIRDVDFYITRKPGVFVNGELHWLATVLRGSSESVVSLDISEETIKEIQLPIEPLVNKHKFTTLGVLEGCLCVLVRVTDVRAELWVMENHGVQESWTQRYVINNGLIADFSVRLVWCFKSGEILFCDNWSGALVLYDPKDGSVRKRHTRKLDFISSEAFYVESIVHLNSNTYAGRRRRGTGRNMNQDSSSTKATI